MKINNRRYIGCKTKLLEFIDTSLKPFLKPDFKIFADIFAGTGVVGSHYADKGYEVIMNDTLYSNVVVYEAILGKGQIRKKFIKEEINDFNGINSMILPDNYFSRIYGGKYFSNNDAKKIGYIRDKIEERKQNYTKREYCFLISSLMYSCDRIAHTVGHFESFLKGEPEEKGVKLEFFDYNENVYPAKIYNDDANKVAKQIKADVVYIDPPYNARQYVNFYHVLENLARWNKPTEFEGNSMKFKRNELKSDYCRKKAPELLEDLVMSLDCKLIAVSYNNTYKAGSISSINMITEQQLINILSKRGKVTVKEQNYRAFNSGKTELTGHKEYLYICEVK